MMLGQLSGVQKTVLLLALPATVVLLYWLLKRNDDDDDPADHIVTSRQATIEVRVPRDMVGAVIGREGANIKKVQEKTNCRINFKDDHGPAEGPERIAIIRGKPGNAQEAELLIRTMIQNQPVILTEEMFVPQKTLGRIIGKGGVSVKEMQRISQAKIKVDSGPLNSTDRNPDSLKQITIKGSMDQIASAKALIEEKVQEDIACRARIEVNASHRERRVKKQRYRDSGDSARPVKTEWPSHSHDDYVEVYVSAVEHPGHFWVQLVSSESTQLDKMITDMTDYYTENPEQNQLENVKVGDLVAAPFEQDNQWYRATVNSVDQGVLDLYYVDFGDSIYLPVDQIRSLRHDYLYLPFQALECRLANVEPVDKEWSDEATDLFESLVYCAQWKVIMARTIDVEHMETSEHPLLELVDTSVEQDINIGEKLVQAGFAMRTNIEKEPEGKCPEVSDSHENGESFSGNKCEEEKPLNVYAEINKTSLEKCNKEIPVLSAVLDIGAKRKLSEECPSTSTFSEVVEQMSKDCNVPRLLDKFISDQFKSQDNESTDVHNTETNQTLVNDKYDQDIETAVEHRNQGKTDHELCANLIDSSEKTVTFNCHEKVSPVDYVEEYVSEMNFYENYTNVQPTIVPAGNMCAQSFVKEQVEVQAAECTVQDISETCETWNVPEYVKSEVKTVEQTALCDTEDIEKVDPVIILNTSNQGSLKNESESVICGRHKSKDYLQKFEHVDMQEESDKENSVICLDDSAGVIDMFSPEVANCNQRKAADLRSHDNSILCLDDSVITVDVVPPAPVVVDLCSPEKESYKQQKPSDHLFEDSVICLDESSHSRNEKTHNMSLNVMDSSDNVYDAVLPTPYHSEKETCHSEVSKGLVDSMDVSKKEKEVLVDNMNVNKKEGSPLQMHTDELTSFGEMIKNEPVSCVPTLQYLCREVLFEHRKNHSILISAEVPKLSYLCELLLNSLHVELADYMHKVSIVHGHKFVEPKLSRDVDKVEVSTDKMNEQKESSGLECRKSSEMVNTLLSPKENFIFAAENNEWLHNGVCEEVNFDSNCEILGVIPPTQNAAVSSDSKDILSNSMLYEIVCIDGCHDPLFIQKQHSVDQESSTTGSLCDCDSLECSTDSLDLSPSKRRDASSQLTRALSNICEENGDHDIMIDSLEESTPAATPPAIRPFFLHVGCGLSPYLFDQTPDGSTASNTPTNATSEPFILGTSSPALTEHGIMSPIDRFWANSCNSSAASTPTCNGNFNSKWPIGKTYSQAVTDTTGNKEVQSPIDRFWTKSCNSSAESTPTCNGNFNSKWPLGKTYSQAVTDTTGNKEVQNGSHTNFDDMIGAFADVSFTSSNDSLVHDDVPHASQMSSYIGVENTSCMPNDMSISHDSLDFDYEAQMEDMVTNLTNDHKSDKSGVTERMQTNENTAEATQTSKMTSSGISCDSLDDDSYYSDDSIEGSYSLASESTCPAPNYNGENSSIFDFGLEINRSKTSSCNSSPNNGCYGYLGGSSLELSQIETSIVNDSSDLDPAVDTDLSFPSDNQLSVFSPSITDDHGLPKSTSVAENCHPCSDRSCTSIEEKVNKGDVSDISYNISQYIDSSLSTRPSHSDPNLSLSLHLSQYLDSSGISTASDLINPIIDHSDGKNCENEDSEHQHEDISDTTPTNTIQQCSSLKDSLHTSENTTTIVDGSTNSSVSKQCDSDVSSKDNALDKMKTPSVNKSATNTGSPISGTFGEVKLENSVAETIFGNAQAPQVGSSCEDISDMLGSVSEDARANLNESKESSNSVVDISLTDVENLSIIPRTDPHLGELLNSDKLDPDSTENLHAQILQLSNIDTPSPTNLFEVNQFSFEFTPHTGD